MYHESGHCHVWTISHSIANRAISEGIDACTVSQGIVNCTVSPSKVTVPLGALLLSGMT